jgi:hypothetical protein
VFGKISRRRRASVVLPLDEAPLMPTMIAFLSPMLQTMPPRASQNIKFQLGLMNGEQEEVERRSAVRFLRLVVLGCVKTRIGKW